MRRPRRRHLDVDDAPGAIDETTLVTDETAGPIGIRRERAVMHEIDAKHPCALPLRGPRAHRPGRTSAILWPRHRPGSAACEHEEAVRADMRCQVHELVHLWTQRFEARSRLQPNQQARATLTITCIGQEGCRLEELMPSASSTGPRRSSGTIGPKVAGLWIIDTRRSGLAGDLDFDDPAPVRWRSRFVGMPFTSAHVLRGDGGVADEGHFTMRPEEALEIVVGGLGRNDERDFRAVYLACDAMHVLVGEFVCIEHDHGRVARESVARKRVYVEQAAGASGHAEGSGRAGCALVPDARVFVNNQPYSSPHAGCKLRAA